MKLEQTRRKYIPNFHQILFPITREWTDFLETLAGVWLRWAQIDEKKKKTKQKVVCISQVAATRVWRSFGGPEKRKSQSIWQILIIWYFATAHLTASSEAFQVFNYVKF